MFLYRKKQANFFVIVLKASLVSANQDSDSLQRGEYIFNLGGCISCHTPEGGDPLAGGLKMETEFGDFYTPNISTDKETGIERWSNEDFIAAMTKGEDPDGQHFYPSFPFHGKSSNCLMISW